MANRATPSIGSRQTVVYPHRDVSLAALLRVHLTYAWRHRRLLSLDAPTHFTELVQRRKLFDHDQRLPLLIDKIAAKQFVADLLGEDWVTPTLWAGTVLPGTPPWPQPFVVKSTHGCNQYRFIRTGVESWAEVQRAAKGWMRRNYGSWLDEWGYRGIVRGLLVEPYIGTGDVLPFDYKIYVFHGRAAFIQVHLDRGSDHRWLVFDLDWRRVSSPTAEPDPPRPVSISQMIEGAEILARGFDFIRIDFYEIEGQPRFGECTFYPGSGLDRFDPPELDIVMGALWLGADAGAAAEA